MRNTVLIAALLPALGLSLSAQAAKWVTLDNRNQAHIEVDSASIHTPGEGKTRLWHRESFTKPRIPESGAFSYSRLTTLTEFQCEKRLAATLQQSYARAEGTELKNETFDGLEAKPILPDSPLETVFNYACKHRSKPVAETPAPPAPPPAPVQGPVPEKKVSKESKESAKKSKGEKEKPEEPPPPPPPRWSYTGNNGPDKWGSLGKEYATCSLGQRQTPIDIQRTIRADLPPIQYLYKPVPLSIVDTGYTIRVDTPEAGLIRADGESYELTEFHFHKPGEEKINGKTYDMSVHLVHQSKAGKIAVVAVQIEAGKKEHPLIRALWTHLPLEQDKPVTRANIKYNPDLLLPEKRNYYTFLGSLNTPPCTEGVLWLVHKTPIQLSREQLAGFSTLYRKNVRPIQTVNNRVIKESR